MYKLTVILWLVLFQTISLNAQPKGADTAFHRSAVNSALSFYAASQGEHAELYTGSEYTGLRYPLFKDHPFFLSDSAVRATIYYSGMAYAGIPMWYDLVNDMVIVLNEFGNVRIVLQSSKVRDFDLAGHHFVRVDSVGTIPAGFYDQRYRGASTLLVKRSKNATQIIDEMKPKTAVRANNDLYYVVKDGDIHRFRKAAAIKKILEDKRREIQQYMKANKIRFSRDREGSMVKVLAYYDTITR